MFSAAKIAAPSAGGYTLSKSLRFRSSASAYLNRTPASASNRKTWTFSAWVKRGKLGSYQDILSAGLGTGGGSDETFLRFAFTSSDQLYITGNQNVWLTTNAVYRDPSAWYHIVLAFDATQSTATNRILFYVNGVQVTSFATNNLAAYVSNQNYAVNNTVPQVIGIESGSSAPPSGTSYLDGYLTEVNFVDGQYLTPSSFGSFNSVTGVWQPIKYSGTYGTNGFYLPFTNTTSTTTLGYDSSGNGNNWTTNNISLTAGSTYDSMTDVPTLTSATVANYPVLNVLQPNPNGTPTYSNGNLFVNCASASSFSCVPATMLIPTTGKWYAEFYLTNGSTTSDVGILGINDFPPTSYVIGAGANSYAYRNTGNKLNNSNNVSYGASYATGDTIGVALDMGAGTLTFYKNNTSQGVAFTGLTSQYYFAVDGYNFTQWSCNFGQQPFTYTPPSGFVALNTYNLPIPTILAGNKYMDATLYTGNGGTQTITNTAGFQPDLVWYKCRSYAYDNSLFDSIRGASNQLVSNLTQTQTSLSGVTAFNSNGFSLGSSINGNNNTSTYVAWQWQAGKGTTSSNTNGSITSTVSVNASAGFSIVTYTGTGSSATVGHGLGVAPQLIIAKSTTVSGSDWPVYHVSNGTQGTMQLDTTSGFISSSNYWGASAPTSTVFGVANGNFDNNHTGSLTVAYCWAAIPGFSAFGSYTGNGSNDGPMIYTGFRPKWLLIKNSGQSNDWFVMDSSMNTYNVIGEYLYPNLSNASNTFSWVDFLSNGFKIRSTGTGNNNNGIVQIYAAFAENPLKYSLSR